MTCGTCKWLDVKWWQSEKKDTSVHTLFPCTVEIPEPSLPASAFLERGTWPPEKFFMGAGDGNGCPFHEGKEFNPFVRADGEIAHW